MYIFIHRLNNELLQKWNVSKIPVTKNGVLQVQFGGCVRLHELTERAKLEISPAPRMPVTRITCLDMWIQLDSYFSVC